MTPPPPPHHTTILPPKNTTETRHLSTAHFLMIHKTKQKQMKRHHKSTNASFHELGKTTTSHGDTLTFEKFKHPSE